ncbi:MAG: hypothetical protein NTU88_13950 [Armatimonadetes bacterium]|nr:hypothetical protein [Armatimonadota bacterium]
MRTLKWGIIALTVGFGTSACAQAAQVVRSFKSHGRSYQVAFVERPGRDTAWRQDLVLRWRWLNQKEWHEIQSVAGVRLERTVKLRGWNGEQMNAVVVSRPGGSAQFISVIQITRSPAGLHSVLTDEVDKGAVDYLRDRRGLLTDLRFHYKAWHYEPDQGSADGHVLTVRELTWSPRSGKFLRGTVRIDREAERKAALSSLLMCVGSDAYLGVKKLSSEGQTVAVIYRPVGILRDKTPKALRSSAYVRADIRLAQHGHKPDALVSLQPWKPRAQVPVSNDSAK